MTKMTKMTNKKTNKETERHREWPNTFIIAGHNNIQPEFSRI